MRFAMKNKPRRQYEVVISLFFIKTRLVEAARTLEKGFGEQRELREDKVMSTYKRNNDWSLSAT